MHRLLRRGVRVHEYHAAIMHAKSAVFDGRRAIVGTSNLDRQSLELSYEVNVVLEGGGAPERLALLFEEDRKRSRRIDRKQLDARSVVERIVDRLAASLLWVV
jgi:cardiolipin synthase